MKDKEQVSYGEVLPEAADMKVSERALAYGGKQQGDYTLEDYYALPDDQRVELIDGVFYDMASPLFAHQRAGGEIYRQIANYIMDRGGACIPFIAPVDVQLDCDDKTMVQPDVGILCDQSKRRKRVIYGAPDFLVEVLSPSTRRKDMTLKLQKYVDAGVREYWMVDLRRKAVITYFFEAEDYPIIYGFEEPIPVRLYGGDLMIDLRVVRQWLEEEEYE